MKVKAFFKKTGALIYKHRADIEFIFGVGLVATGTGLLIKNAPKISEAIDEHTMRRRTIDECDEEDAKDPGAGWLDAKERHDKVKEDFALTMVDFGKALSIPVVCIITGEVIQGVSHVSLRKDLNKAYALVGTLSTAYNTLKKRIVEDQGQEKLDEYLYGPKVKKVVVDQDGNVTETFEYLEDSNSKIDLPPHCFFFDESNRNFEKSPIANYDFLVGRLRNLQLALDKEGFLWENDIRRECEAELVECGWTSGIRKYNDDGTINQLSFGFESTDPATQRFLDHTEGVYLVKLNMEDDIMSKLHLRRH